jgi:DNA topoisomerase-1
MSQHVVIVESPAKCKTINKYLGNDYIVLASYGHIRDLPSKDGSVRPDEDFAMDYQISADSKKNVTAIANAVKGAKSLILATDPDREGEAISWHVLEALKEKKIIKDDFPVQRVAFSSITKEAVQHAVANPRKLDLDLVNAQQARRALDYLVGFNVSPVLWRKLPGSKSAGRVQSVALRLICEREHEIEIFKPQEYWDIKADFKTPQAKKFTATLTHIEDKKLAKFDLPNGEDATSVKEKLEGKEYTVANVTKKQSKRNPQAPFTTSTLQQEASRKLGYGAKQTMMVAQKLYEGMSLGGDVTGVITYMRTDGVTVAPEAIAATREHINSVYGAEYLPKEERTYSTKQKNAQEAHEAIRPTDPTRTPASIKEYLSDEQFKLYDLIWKRLLASQMESVVLDQVAADIKTTDGYATLRANGSTVRFDGFYKVYREGTDDDKADDGDDKMLPPLNENDAQDLQKIDAAQHFTQPPPRFSEASLVKRMEELGIGRPSTYAAILSVLQEREYVILDKKRFIPEMRGRLVTSFLSSFFAKYVEYDFTAELENELDAVSAGKLEWKEALRNFWTDFNECVKGAMNLEFTKVIDVLNEELALLLFPGEGTIEERRCCAKCGKGEMSLKLGKFGAFLGCSLYPDCNQTVQLGGKTGEDGEDLAAQAAMEPRHLGLDPETGKDLVVRKGPYGFYVQLGEGVKADKEKKIKAVKPKRASLAKDKNPEELTLEDAIIMMSLPRVLGTHPETGNEIEANIGRFGPYLKHDGKFTSIKGDDDVYTIGLNRAVTVLAEAPKKAGSEPLRALGAHPDGGDINVYEGRYGPYVKHAKVNATIPKDMDKDTVTLEQAVELIKIQAEKKKTKKKK